MDGDTPRSDEFKSPDELPPNVIPIGPYLTRDEILAMDDIVTEDVVVPQWNNRVVRVRGLTGTQRDAYEIALIEEKGNSRKVNLQNLRAKLITLSCVDAEGNLLFTQKDVIALGKKGAAALQVLFKVAQRLSGLGEDEIEELSKGLGEEPSADSGSD